MAKFLILTPSGWWHLGHSRSWVVGWGLSGGVLPLFCFLYGFRTCRVGHLECACLIPHISNFWSKFSKTSATPTAGRYILIIGSSLEIPVLRSHRSSSMAIAVPWGPSMAINGQIDGHRWGFSNVDPIDGLSMDHWWPINGNRNFPSQKFVRLGHVQNFNKTLAF